MLSVVMKQTKEMIINQIGTAY